MVNSRKTNPQLILTTKRVYLFIFAICTCLTNVYSQLQVDSTGYVGIGVTDEILEDEEADSIMSFFSVCTAGDEDILAFFTNLGRTYSVNVENYQTGNNSNGIALRSFCSTRNGDAQGLLGIATANYSNNNSNYSVGVRGVTIGGKYSVGVYGGSVLLEPVSDFFAGIYGSDTSGFPSSLISGTYAGYFNGTVRATGPMYAQAFYTPSANPTGGGNNENTSVSLIGEEERVTDKLRNVTSFELQHSEQTTLERRSNPVEEFLRGRDVQELTKKELYQLDSIAQNISSEKKDPLSSVNYGLDAEQLKAMFPKLVQQDKEGNYSINYVEMIPLLVKSINELSEELEELKGASRNKAKAQSETTTAIDNNVTDIDMVRMDQNKPNPFSESTVIGLNIPDKTQKANIFIYDLSGKQIQSIPVSERSETNITVYAGELGAGMYIYTLVVDGKVAVTRRMIVSE